MALPCPRPERCNWCGDVGPCAWVVPPAWCLCEAWCLGEFTKRTEERSSWE